MIIVTRAEYSALCARVAQLEAALVEWREFFAPHVAQMIANEIRGGAKLKNPVRVAAAIKANRLRKERQNGLLGVDNGPSEEPKGS